MLEWYPEIICPYCGEEIKDDYPVPNATLTQVCEHCGKKFVLHTLGTVVYNTAPITDDIYTDADEDEVKPISVIKYLTKHGACVSQSTAKRMVAQGAVMVDGVPVTDVEQMLSTEQQINVLSGE